MARIRFYDRRIELLVSHHSRQTAEKAAQVTKKRARRNAPVDTGDLKKSIRSKVTRHGEYSKFIVYTDKEYAIYQEFGTRGSQAKPGGVLAFKPKGSGTVVFAKRTGPVPATRFLGRAYDALSIRDFVSDTDPFLSPF